MQREEAEDIFRELENAIANFVGGLALVRAEILPAGRSRRGGAGGGGVERRGQALLGRIGGNRGVLLEVLFRRNASFSDFEAEVLDQVFRAISLFCRMELGEQYSGHRKVAILSSSFDAAIARTARGARTGNFWKIQQIIQILKRLCWQEYEGVSSTSGFFFVENFRKFLSVRLPRDIRFVAFPKPIPVGRDFFSGTLSYRYIDGKRACYLVDQNLRCYGILQSDRREMSWGDLLIHKNFSDLLSLPELAGKAFGIFSNQNREIDLLLKEGNQIRWVDNGWKLVDRKLLAAQFREFIAVPAELDNLIDVVLSISAARHGALILLPDAANAWRAQTAGHTDTTLVGKSLRASLTGKSLSELEEDGLLLKILSSDGSVVLDRRARLLDAGVLFRLGDGNENGGSRTAAARSASRFGLAVKISVDGPVQIYREQELRFQI